MRTAILLSIALRRERPAHSTSTNEVMTPTGALAFRRPPVLRGLRVLIVSLEQEREIEHRVGIVRRAIMLRRSLSPVVEPAADVAGSHRQSLYPRHQ